MRFLLADSFTGALARLPTAEAKAVKTTVVDLQIDPTGKGLSFHRIDKSKDPNFRLRRGTRAAPVTGTLAGMALIDVSLDRLRRKKDCQFRMGEIPWLSGVEPIDRRDRLGRRGTVRLHAPITWPDCIRPLLPKRFLKGRRFMMTSIERQTMKKVYLRLLPFCFVLYFICYLDRVNIGFAALTMNKDLGFSSYIFGLGAGAFFWGYFLLEVPSNLILDRVGARRWIARVMVSWGLVSGAFAFINGPVSFFILRFLLGLAEAGFFPGIILYFTYWFPPSHRSRIVAGFMAAIPVSIGLGAPVSTALLELDGVLGIAGWRWLFLCEAAPAVIFGIATFFYLTDRPAQANWLEAEEREWLATEM